MRIACVGGGPASLYSSVLMKLRANFRTISNEQWHSGKVVLVGDSARTAKFTIGMGATLAIGDAIALGESPDGSAGMDAALTRHRHH